MATPNLTYVGYTNGAGAGETHATPDVPGFQTAYQNSGPGSPPNGSGAQYSRCIKYFPQVSEGYPNFPTTWASLTNLAAIVAAATTSVFPMVVFGSAPTLAIPSAAGIQSFISSLPAGQQCAWIYVSEVEAGTDLPAATYVANVATFSTNLNTALASLRSSTGSGFYTRANFAIVHSARMDHYSTSKDDTGSPIIDQSYIPNSGTCDCYTADLYRKGPKTAAPASSGARYQGFVRSVNAKLGTSVSFGFGEYGIDGNVFTDAQKAGLLAADFAYLTGSSRPGLLPVMFWNYWYQVGNSTEAYPFSGGSQPQTTAQWQSMIAYSEGTTGQNTVTVNNPGLQTSTVGQVVSLQISASDSDPSQNSKLNYSLGATLLPPGLHLNGTTGLITGQPTTPGTTQTITVTATDTTAAHGSATFSWVVNQPTTETVTVINPGTQTSTRHLAINPVNIQASDSLGLALNYTQLNLPAGLAISATTGQITGTPTTLSAPSVTVTATSPTPVASSAVFTWNIVASVVTVASPGNQSNVTNDQVSLQMTATDTAGLTVTFTDPGVTLPTGLTISAAGLISGTCTAAGTFNVSITGTDTDGVTGTAAFTWTVAATVVTVTNPGNVITNTFALVNLPIIAKDSADNALTYSDGGTLPPGLTIASATGIITGQPTTAGVYQVTITASDAIAVVSGSTTFTWTINQAATVLVVSIAPLPGVDIYGNSYPAGIQVGKAGGPLTTIGLDGTLKYTPTSLTLGNMINGWARNTASGGHAFAVLDVLGNLVVSFKNLQVGTKTDGTQIFAAGAFPPSARPHDNRRVVAAADGAISATESVQLEFRTDGSVAVYGIAAGTTRLDFNGIVPLVP